MFKTQPQRLFELPNLVMLPNAKVFLQKIDGLTSPPLAIPSLFGQFQVVFATTVQLIQYHFQFCLTYRRSYLCRFS